MVEVMKLANMMNGKKKQFIFIEIMIHEVVNQI
jgi:hypothetical protein